MIGITLFCMCCVFYTVPYMSHIRHVILPVIVTTPYVYVHSVNVIYLTNSTPFLYRTHGYVKTQIQTIHISRALRITHMWSGVSLNSFKCIRDVLVTAYVSTYPSGSMPAHR